MPNIKEFYMGIDGECTFEYDNDEIKKLKLSEVSTRGGPGAALGATYTAIDADDGKIWPTPVNCTVTVNTGLIAGFGQGFTGAGVVSFAGTATVTDKRTTGATNPVCSLVNIGTNTYEIWGTKA